MKPETELELSERDFGKRTRRSFIFGGLFGLSGVGFWAWLMSRADDAGVPWPLRKALRFNESVWKHLFAEGRLGARPEAPPSGTMPRINGDIGLSDELADEDWKLSIEAGAIGTVTHRLSLEELRALPRLDSTTQFRCIEGWSRNISYSGVRFSELLSHLGISPNHRYVGLETPDGQYYVSIDMESMLHPQTAIAYEMNGAPLADENGAPARLVIPVKYGIKNLKRIGRIFFSDERPRDYWAERGYDWYSGL